jgi:hypothetical protein
LIDHAAIDAALGASFREMLLEHARLGRSVCESRGGKVVWVTPAEIFARYGLDVNGRPKPKEEPVPPPDPLLEAQIPDLFALDQMYTDGKLDQYRGEFVFYANGTIFGHGRSLVEHRPKAEAAAAAAGIPPERLLDYFVLGEPK